jgi:hypothetical protein
LFRFCSCPSRPQNLTRQPAPAPIVSANAERSNPLLKEELGNTRRAVELRLGRNSSLCTEISQLSERFRSLSSTQKQNNPLHDELGAFHAPGSAMSKRISDLGGQIDDTTRLPQRVTRVI